MGTAGTQQPTMISLQAEISISALPFLCAMEAVKLPAPASSNVPGHVTNTSSAVKEKEKATELPPKPVKGDEFSLLLTKWRMVKHHLSAKKKGMGKVKELEPSTLANEQLTQLLEQLHNARVLEDIGVDVLENPVVQLALTQVLNQFDTVRSQRDKACSDLFQSALNE
ncbi:hypothetical protein C0989_000706 [Termitomyces sp. Mn162]|nr:hypothetical protein C0989_000706 [Termitomyces sp. Mn162]